jgi:hypothetical protein
MNHWLDNTWRHLQIGEALITGGVEELVHGWQKASTDLVGKLCTGGAERWQAAIRQIQSAPVNLAEILRARALL